jgi:hypothetical protein
MVPVIFHSSINSKNDETGFYKFTCTFTTLEFGGAFKSVLHVQYM